MPSAGTRMRTSLDLITNDNSSHILSSFWKLLWCICKANRQGEGVLQEEIPEKPRSSFPRRQRPLGARSLSCPPPCHRPVTCRRLPRPRPGGPRTRGKCV